MGTAIHNGSNFHEKSWILLFRNIFQVKKTTLGTGVDKTAAKCLK